MKESFSKKITLFGSFTGLFVVLLAIGQIILTYVINTKYPNPQPIVEEILNTLYTHNTLALSVMILSMLVGVFVIPTAISIFVYMKEKSIHYKKWLFIPLVTLILGSFLIITAYIIQIFIVTNLAQKFQTSLEPEKSLIITDYQNLVTIVYILSIIFYILLFGIGTGLLAFISLKSKLGRLSINWIAIIGASLTIGRVGVFLENIFGSILMLLAQIGSITFLFWITRTSIDMLIDIRTKKNSNDIEV